MSWQFAWYQMLHVSQQIAFWLQVTPSLQVPQSHLGLLGPGFSCVTRERANITKNNVKKK